MGNSITTGNEYGERLRRARNMRGYSLAQLADMYPTSPQHIHQWEKGSLTNVEDIQKLSNILGFDLLQSENDTEGIVGEIGKQIIIYLLSFEGYNDASELFRVFKYDYGMSKESVTHELFKLLRIGMCVRENYKDLYGREQDKIYVTAKGLITAKNNGWGNTELSEANDGDFSYSYVKTYEKICNGCNCYAEYLESLNADEDVLKLRACNGFRVNLINYIHNTYLYSKENRVNLEFFPGDNLFADVMIGMVHHITREHADSLVELAKPSKYILDDEKHMMGFHISSEIELSQNMVNKFITDYISGQIVSEEKKGTLKYQIKQLGDEIYCAYDNPYEFHNDYLEKNYHKGIYRDYIDEFYVWIKEHGENPLNWFGEEEIVNYLLENVKPAVTDEEKAIEERIIRIFTNNASLYSYFNVPNEWKDNSRIMNTIIEVFNFPLIHVQNSESEEIFEIPAILFFTTAMVKDDSLADIKVCRYSEIGNQLDINILALLSRDQIRVMTEKNMKEFAKKTLEEMINESNHKDEIEKAINEHPGCRITISLLNNIIG